MTPLQTRFYRNWVARHGLCTFEVREGESDLQIRAGTGLRAEARRLLKAARSEVEAEIAKRPAFAESLAPLPMPPDAGSLVRGMYAAARVYDVGPMAAVAGAVAEAVGEGLLPESPEVIVENGGDLYLKVGRPVEMGLYAGEGSPFSGALRVLVDGAGRALGVCASSGTVGHSLSFGKADAVVAVAEDAALADAAATSLANRVRTPEDVAPVLEAERDRGRLLGLLIVIGKRMGAYGAIQLAR